MDGENFKWPSERVAKGGLFHPPKVKYSKETNDLLKLLMEEARLSMMLRKQINYHLREGNPLPLPEVKKNSSCQNDENVIASEIIRRANTARRKSYEAIKKSGAYDQPKYRPLPNLKEPTDRAKLKLQESMSGMKLSTTNVKPKNNYSKGKKPTAEPKEQINDLLQQIDERAVWLAEMEELGEGRKYRDVIHAQIAEKLRQIREVEKKMDAMEKIARMEEIESLSY